MFSLLTFFIDLKLFLKQFVENIEFFNTGSFDINLKSFISKYTLGQLKPTTSIKPFESLSFYKSSPVLHQCLLSCYLASLKDPWVSWWLQQLSISYCFAQLCVICFFIFATESRSSSLIQSGIFCSDLIWLCSKPKIKKIPYFNFWFAIVKNSNS